ncbi:hypothetical protein ABMA27_010084 [Loxostege sticticalis]|uniref:FP protein C-terminal domain-containing protein n=1 Tax=Loxostege sticticalis TaxID=481309 RepID=A0ABR3H4N6_LOXSC
MSQTHGLRKWACCAKDEGDSECNICAECGLAYHLVCLGLSVPTEGGEWRCPKCAVRKLHSDDTLIRTLTDDIVETSEDNVTRRATKRQAISSPIAETSTVTRDDVHNIVKGVFKSEMGVLLTQMNNNFAMLMNRELQGLKSEITEMKESMNFMSLQYEEFKDKHQAVLKSMDELRMENTDLRTTVTHLTGRVDQLEQQARASNIELQCIPEKKAENLLNIVSSICKVVNCPVKPENIIKCTRIAKIDPAGLRPRSIVVQFSSPNVRDHLLASVKTYNKSKKTPDEKLNTSNIGLKCDKKPIYVVEHLTPSNKALHAAARLRAKENKYKYVWIRNGRVFVRKSDDTDYIMIKDMNSIEKIV